MTRTSNYIALATILFAGASSAAWAQGPGGMGHPGFRGELPPIPDLTQDQKSKIAELKSTAMKQTAPLHDQIVLLHKAIHVLWAADNLDRAAIAAKQTEVDGVQAKVKGIWTDFFFQLHDVLTSAQRTWMAAHGPGKGRHHGGAGFGMGQGHECPCAE